MNEHGERPAIGVAHVVMHTPRLAESFTFMRSLGMRPIFDGPRVSILEMRGGTHLILMLDEQAQPRDASFDLMVDDVREAHRRFEALGLAPSPIESRPAVSHELFTVREPGGHTITIYSSHAAGRPV
jgi:catechol 2,3-dioxygenase-like lactoylglutathione lyase family enzyme